MINKTGSIILMAVVLILFMPAFVVAAGIVELPKTGQTTCYDSSGSVIACTGTGQGYTGRCFLAQSEVYDQHGWLLRHRQSYWFDVGKIAG